MADRVAPINANTYPVDSFRELIQGLVPTQGVVSAGDLAVSQHAGTPGMNVDVAAGAAFLQGIRSTVTQGTYHFLKDAVQTYTIAAADPTNPRRDLVCAVITDSVYAVDGTPNTQNVRVLTGTPAGSPVDPSIPSTWSAYVLLARVAVAANASSIVNANITDLRVWAQPVRRATVLGTAGPPTSGTYAVGDEVSDKWGATWICSVAGTPGTWRYGGGGCYTASAYKSSAQNIANNTDSVRIDFDAINYDPVGSFDTVNKCYTCPVPGVYAVSFRFTLTPNSTWGAGDVFASWAINGTQQGHGLGRHASRNGTDGLVGSFLRRCIAGDLITISAYANSATSWAVGTGTGDSAFDIALVASGA